MQIMSITPMVTQKYNNNGILNAQRLNNSERVETNFNSLNISFGMIAGIYKDVDLISKFTKILDKVRDAATRENDTLWKNFNSRNKGDVITTWMQGVGPYQETSLENVLSCSSDNFMKTGVYVDYSKTSSATSFSEVLKVVGKDKKDNIVIKNKGRDSIIFLHNDKEYDSEGNLIRRYFKTSEDPNGYQAEIVYSDYKDIGDGRVSRIAKFIRYGNLRDESLQVLRENNVDSALFEKSTTRYVEIIEADGSVSSRSKV